MSAFVLTLTQPSVRLTAKLRENKKALTEAKIPFTTVRDPLLAGTFLTFDALFPGTDIPVSVMLPEKAPAYKDQFVFMPKGQNGLSFYNAVNAVLIAAFGRPQDSLPDASSCHWVAPDHTLTHRIAEVRPGHYIEEIRIDFGKKRPTSVSDRYEKIEALYASATSLLPGHVFHCLSYSVEGGLPVAALDADQNGRGVYLMARGGTLFASRYTVYQSFDAYGRPVFSRQADESSRSTYPCRNFDELLWGIRSFLPAPQ